MKRLFDVFVVVAVGVLCFVPFCAIALLVRLTSPGPILYWSDRVGRYNKIFKMPKFRSMRVDTPAVATHLLANPDTYLTPVGAFLRKTSLDELPQLWSILAGDMSFVGPRPALYNQQDLIELRTRFGIQRLVPGLTGWAQINGRDELEIAEKVAFDVEYMRRRSLWFDCYIIWNTAIKVMRRDGVIEFFGIALPLGDVARNAENSQDLAVGIVQRTLGGEEDLRTRGGGQHLFLGMRAVLGNDPQAGCY